MKKGRPSPPLFQEGSLYLSIISLEVAEEPAASAHTMYMPGGS